MLRSFAYIIHFADVSNILQLLWSRKTRVRATSDAYVRVCTVSMGYKVNLDTIFHNIFPEYTAFATQLQ